MKRSEINSIMQEAIKFIEWKMNLFLPPFAKWTPEVWKKKDWESADIVEQQLGWAITEFGTDDCDGRAGHAHPFL